MTAPREKDRSGLVALVCLLLIFVLVLIAWAGQR